MKNSINKFFILKIILILIIFPSCTGKTEKKQVKQEIVISKDEKEAINKDKNAKLLWSNRGDKDTLLKSIQFWEESYSIYKKLDKKPRIAEISLNLTKAYFFLSYFYEGKEKRIEKLKKGSDFGYESLMLKAPKLKKALLNLQIFESINIVTEKEYDYLYYYTLNNFFLNIEMGEHYLMIYKDDLSSMFKQLEKLKKDGENLYEFIGLYYWMMPKIADGNKEEGQKYINKAKELNSKSIIPFYLEAKYIKNENIDSYAKIIEKTWFKTPENDIIYNKLKKKVDKNKK